MSPFLGALTIFSNSLHQHVELVHEHLLLTVHHPGEALLQSLARTDCISHAASQLFCCRVAHQSVELWDT